MSQRLNAGFNAPRPFVRATDIDSAPSILACAGSIGCIFAPGRPLASSFALGVNHPATSLAVRGNDARLNPSPGTPLWSRCCGVGHPPQSLPDMRRADARSAQIGGPDCIGQLFQVSAYSVEP